MAPRQDYGYGSSSGPDLPAAQTPARKRTYTKARSLNLSHHTSGESMRVTREKETSVGRGGEDTEQRERHGAYGYDELRRHREMATEWTRMKS